MLDLVTIPDPRLRQKVAPVERFDPPLRSLVRAMLETLHAAKGVGLAAPQVGEALRLLVVHVPADDPRIPEGHALGGKPLVLVNPELLEASAELEEGIEGCLSIPGYAGMVPRHRRLVVQARNEWGRPRRYAVDGYLARVFQHEMDHLDGILFLDRLTGDDKLFRIVEEDEAAATPTLASEHEPASVAPLTS